MSEKKSFEENKVLLWGEKPVKLSLLKLYDIGNKNPRSKARVKKDENKDDKIEEKPVKNEVIKKEFNLDDEYNVDDLEFLNQEYDRIDKKLSSKLDADEEEELTELQDKLYELIEGLEAMKKFKGGNVGNQKIDKPSISTVIKSRGYGFKKGSPEALAHAQKMREARNIKEPKIPTIKQDKKSRVIKGSEEAKNLSKKLIEAKKAKKALKVEDKEQEKPKKGKAWYYIGDIPKGYREATEDEAILNNKVSEYGKYVVDNEKLRLYRDYNIFLTENKTLPEITGLLLGLKKRVLKSLQEIEILENKISNDKYEDKKDEFKNKLKNQKELRKYLQAGYNWYYKLYCERTGKEYVRQKISLPKIELDESKISSETPQVKEKGIHPKIEDKTDYSDIKKMYVHNPQVNKVYVFSRGGDDIELNQKYFKNKILKSKYAKKLYDKHIILEQKFYNDNDYKNFVYHEI